MSYLKNKFAPPRVVCGGRVHPLFCCDNPVSFLYFLRPQKVKTLFDTAFERSDEAKKASPTGKGVGLYLSGQIIKAHNGKVWAESEGQGRGSTFYVELPVS